jgi:acetyl/propionyl-CoA carboxylase alpha subunit
LKKFVNGEEAELAPTGADVRPFGDRLQVRIDGKLQTAAAVREGDKTYISYQGRQYVIEKASRTTKRGGGAGSGEIHAPMPGLIVDVLVQDGQTVAKGDKIVVLEAMKTQQAFSAAMDGTVVALPVKKGDQVVDGQLLAKVSDTTLIGRAL